eukprot:894198-Prorocentrum_minimum.AAC.1
MTWLWLLSGLRGVCQGFPVVLFRLSPSSVQTYARAASLTHPRAGGSLWDRSIRLWDGSIHPGD